MEFYDNVITEPTLLDAPVAPLKTRASFGQRLLDKALHTSFGAFSGLTSAAGITATTIGANFLHVMPYFPSIPAFIVGGLGSIALGAGMGAHESFRKSNIDPCTGLSYDYDRRKNLVNPSENHIIRTLGITSLFITSVFGVDAGLKKVQSYFDNQHMLLSKQQKVQPHIPAEKPPVPAYYTVSNYKMH